MKGWGYNSVVMLQALGNPSITKVKGENDLNIHNSEDKANHQAEQKVSKRARK
jgi:hypothetical protein